jgi:hypothetical protein
MQLKTPDVTTAQVVTLIQAVIGLVIAFGFPVSDDQRDAIVQLVTAVAVVLPLADAIIRNGRARGNTNRH